MVVDKIQQIGWRHDSGTDPIDAVNAKYWLHGIRTESFKDLHPTESHLILPIYKGNKRNPTEMQLIRTEVAGLAIGFFPTNLIPYYLVLGSHSEAADIHTITNINTGALPTWTQRSESTGGDVDEIFSVPGCKAESLSGLLDMTGLGIESQTLTYNGIENVTPTLNEKHTTGAMHPTTSGTMVSANQVVDDYRRSLTGFDFQWDVDGTPVDYSAEGILFSYMIANKTLLRAKENQAKIAYIDEGTYQFGFTFSLWRGASNRIFDDYLTEALDFKMTLKVYASATYYKTLTWDNCALASIKPPYSVGNDKPTWEVEGMATDFEAKGKDGLHGAAAKTEFYES